MCADHLHRLWDKVGLMEIEKALEVDNSILSPLPATYWTCSLGTGGGGEGDNSASLSFGFFITKMGVMKPFSQSYWEG